MTTRIFTRHPSDYDVDDEDIVDVVDYSDIDPNIREVVSRLCDAGFTTTDSGDGVSKRGMECALDFPHVVMTCAPEALVFETQRLLAVVESWGVDVSPVGRGAVWIQADYDPTDGTPTIMLAGVSDEVLK